MQYSGAIAGPVAAQTGIVAAAGGASRDARTEAVAATAAPKRLQRDENAIFIRSSDAPEDAISVVSRRQGFDLPHHRHGAPSSAYLAQHIAQEVSPDHPGFDSHQAGSRAYAMRRDSTVEILMGSGRLDVFV